MSPTPTRRRWPRRLAFVALVLVVLVVVVRAVLDPVATRYTRKALDDADGIRGRFESVHVTVFPPGYAIEHLKIIRHPGGNWKQPLLYADRVHVGLRPNPLLRRRIVAHVLVEEPKLIVSPQAAAKPVKEAAEEVKEKAKEEVGPAFDLQRSLSKLIPLQVDIVEIDDGEILYLESSRPDAARLWIHRLNLTAENFATRTSLMKGEPSTLTAHAVVQRTGKLSVDVTADPLAKGLTFTGRVALRDLALRDLYSLIEPATGLQATSGTASVFADFRARNGVLSGGVKPVLANVEVRGAGKDVTTRLKGWLADKAVDLASDDVPGRDAVATIIPIKGRITDPDVQVMPAVMGVIRNAFVVALTSGFANLPPPTAEKKEGVLKQAADALDKDKGPPEAQPKKSEPSPQRRGRRAH